MISDSAWTGFSPIRNPSIGFFKSIRLLSHVKAPLSGRVAGWRAATGDGEPPRVVRGRTGRRASLACVIMVRSRGRTAGGVVPDAARCAAIGGARRRPRKTLSVCYFAKPRTAVRFNCACHNAREIRTALRAASVVRSRCLYRRVLSNRILVGCWLFLGQVSE